MSARIYAALIESCEPAVLDAPWRLLPPDENSLLRADDLTTDLESWRDQFGEEELLTAGILVQIGDRVQLNPKLMTEDRLLIVFRDADGHPLDIATSHGTLQNRVPAFACLRDHQTCRALRETDRRLFVASTMQDTVLLRSMGLPAAQASSLDKLRERNITHLQALADEFSSPSNFVHFVLLGCDLAADSFEMPASMASVATFLAKVKEHLELPGLALSVWWPSPQEISGFRFCWKLGSAGRVSELLQQEDSLRDVEEFIDPSQVPPREPSYASVLEDLLAAEAASRRNPCCAFAAERLSEASQKYASHVDRVIFEPLASRALDACDPSLRAVRLQLAHICRLVHKTFPRVHDAQTRSIESERGDPILFLSDEGWERFGAMTDMMTKLVREEIKIQENSSSW